MLARSLTAEFDHDKYQDDYRIQVLDLIGRKAAGEEFELPAVEAAKAARDDTQRRARHPRRAPRSQPSDPRSRGPAGPPDLRCRLACPVGECGSFP